MTKKMDSAERMRRFYAGESCDRVPVIGCLTMYAGRQKGLTSQEFYYDVRKSYSSQAAVINEGGFDDVPCLDFPHGEILDFGGSLGFPEYGPVELPWVNRYPINSEKEAEEFELPEISNREFTKLRLAFLDHAASMGQHGIGIGMGSPFTMAGYMVDTSLFMRWLVRRPDLIEHMIDVAIRYLSETADILIERYGLENCSASANVPFECNSLISVKMFERYALPSLVKIYDIIRDKGVKSLGLHICGDHRRTLSHFKELGLHCGSFISTDELNPIDEVARILGSDNVYAGNIPCRSLVYDSAQTIYNMSLDTIIKMRNNDGGFILMPSCDLPVNTRPENIKAMIRAAEDAGIYR